MTRGEVWWFEHPAAGRRPACVLTRPEAISGIRRVLVTFATTTVRDLPTEVALDEEDGMPQPCVLSLDNVRTVSKAMLVERITTLSPARMHEVCRALAVATAC
ncbi:MAG TPA: type II toxin-antitoxin system PemK/MazF family toxin [Solirubrobacterales bacterium]|nr:type II toxin-antitoxin system PemK/MazF family toxin [Solirubrobacterales bacterium]